MAIFVILAPYGAFAFLMLVTSPIASLLVATAICVMVIAFDLYRGRSVKMLGLGSAIVFAALAAYLVLSGADWSTSAVKLAVDAGVLATTLLSLAIGKPFTLQYAREMVDAETAQSPDFLTANYVITWVWALACVLMMTANAMLLYVPGLPLWSALATAFAARQTAIYFTKWYPSYRKAKFATPTTSSPES